MNHSYNNTITLGLTGGGKGYNCVRVWL